jgi:hypothetical protein
MQLMAVLNEWLKSHGYGTLVEQPATDQIADLAKRFRNPAAHADNFTRDQASEAN